ncbi:hypothetical protein BVG79_02313 [Ketogulonicigenium robustum]|uniref:TRAP transporter small permease protein n=1 Tax=Ketogulonicigenium robustum TaxID=92947 RepID=A0A1W6P2K0_9RHOB|nr:TRAP transporter small permease subunit [Ketogulonicigenium robustum]ARO15653.1 hypothetical protein BVG79_02313 [Ketogulonicigenium robustum]
MTRAFGLLATLCARIAGAGLLLIAALLLVDVVGRAIGRPLFGAQEVTEMVMVVVIFGSVALLDHRGGQIRVDLFAGAMSPAVAALADRLAAFLALALWATLAWATIQAAQLSQMFGLKSNILGVPKAPFQYALAAFAAIGAVGALLRLVAKKPVTGASAND